MIDRENMTMLEHKRYELAHTEPARRRYVEKEWHDAEVLLMAGAFALVWIVYLIGRAFEAALL